MAVTFPKSAELRSFPSPDPQFLMDFRGENLKYLTPIVLFVLSSLFVCNIVLMTGDVSIIF